MRIGSVGSHIAVACAAAIVGYLVAVGQFELAPALAQSPPAGGQKITDLFKQNMDDVGRVLTVRLAERDPGTGSGPHRHPCCYTVGYILSGTYDFKVGDEPLRTLHAGEVFYEPPNALHAVSRNASATEPLKFLIIQVADQSKPGLVPEK
jgi:quercetin dioxygenase-like cupin family protein